MLDSILYLSAPSPDCGNVQDRIPDCGLGLGLGLGDRC